MKKLLTLLLIPVMCCLISVSCASASSDVIVSLTINDPVMEVNGTETEIWNDEYMAYYKKNKVNLYFIGLL